MNRHYRYREISNVIEPDGFVIIHAVTEDGTPAYEIRLLPELKGPDDISARFFALYTDGNGKLRRFLLPFSTWTGAEIAAIGKEAFFRKTEEIFEAEFLGG